MSGAKKTISNFIWRFFERSLAQIVGFIVSIILARMLDPSVYGQIALVTVFTSILQVFVDSGMGSGLIQKKNADNVDFSTVFFFNIVMCIALYGLVFLLAPYIAVFYNDESLTPIVRVVGLTIVISGVKNVQQAYVSRTMQFKRFFWATLGGTLLAAVVGITMASRGYGVWALVFQHLTNLVVDTVVLWFTVRWRPNFVFSFQRLKGLFSYGWKLLVSSLLDRGYTELRQLLIGKFYTSSDLAFYNQGQQFPSVIVANINTSIDSVLLPMMAKEQDDAARVKDMTRRAIKTSTYVMAPMMMGLAFIAEPVVRLVLTDKWLPCVPYLRVFCISFMFYPIHTANLNAIKGMGRSDLFLKLEIIKKVVGLVALAITLPISVKAMGYSLLFTSVASQIINSWPNRKLLNYRYIEQLKDILPIILLAVGMGITVWTVSLLHLPVLLTVLIQILLGAGIYIGGSLLFRMESFNYIISVLKEYRKKKNA